MLHQLAIHCAVNPECFSPLTLPTALSDPEAALAHLLSSSGKLELVDKMVGRLLQGGHRVIIFSQFTKTLDILEDWLQARKWGYQRIDGTIAGVQIEAGQVLALDLLPYLCVHGGIAGA